MVIRLSRKQVDSALTGLAVMAKEHPKADALEYVRHENIVSYLDYQDNRIASLQAENARLKAEAERYEKSFSEWAKGCSCTEVCEPWQCQDCTEAYFKSLTSEKSDT